MHWPARPAPARADRARGSEPSPSRLQRDHRGARTQVRPQAHSGGHPVLAKAALRSFDGRSADGGNLPLAIQERQQSDPRAAPPAEQAHAPPRSSPRAAAMPAPFHRANSRLYQGISRNSPATAGVLHQRLARKRNRPAEIPHAQPIRRPQVVAPEATEALPIEQSGGHGGKPRWSPGAAKSPRATRSRSGSDRCRKNPASLRQSHAAPALRSATPPQRRLPRPRRRSNQREPDTGRVGQSGDQRVTSDPIARIGSMKLGRR